MKLTINAGLSLMGQLKGRISELKGLRNECAVAEERTFFSEPKSETKKEPQYDVKKVDQKIMELQTVIFKIDSEIKAANAKTYLESEVDIDVLLAPLA